MLADRTSAAQSAPILEVRAGLGGKTRAGHWTPVVVDLSTPVDFDGDLVLRTRSGGIPLEVRSAVVVPRGTTARRTLYYVAGEELGRSITVRAESKEGESSQTWEGIVDPVDPRQSLILSINVPPPTPNPRRLAIVSERANDLPNRWEALLPAELVIWAPDRARDEPSPAAMKALLQWVRSGGTLVLSVGANARDCLDTELETLLPGDPDATVSLTSLTTLSEFVNEEPMPLSIDVQPFREPSDRFAAEALLLAEGRSLLWHRPLGAGQVFVLPFDVRAESFRAWSGFGRLLFKLTDASQRRKLAFGRIPDLDRRIVDDITLERFDPVIERSLQAFPFYLPMGVGGILLLFGAYLIVVGPLEWYLLRKWGRVLWTLWTTPLTALLLTSVILASVWGRQSRSVVSRSVSWISVDAASDAATRTAVVALYFPRGGRYTLAPDAPHTLLQVLRTSDRDQLFTTFQGMEQRQDLSGSTFEVPAFAHSVRAFSTQWRGDASACLDADIETGENFLVLRNRSRSRWTGLQWLRQDGTALELGDLEPGASLTLEPSTFAPASVDYQDSDAQSTDDGSSVDRGTAQSSAESFLRRTPALALELLTQSLPPPDRQASLPRSNQQALRRALLLPNRLPRDAVVGRVEVDPQSLDVEGRDVSKTSLCFLRIYLP